MIKQALFVLAVAVPAAAEQARNWRVTTAVDIFAPGNLDKHNREASAGACDDLGAGCSLKVDGAGGGGARVGVRRQRGGWSYGPSLGYIAGGPSSGHWRLKSALGDLDLKNSNQTLRALAEAGKIFSLGGRWSASLAGGVGWAASFERLSCGQTGRLAAFDVCKSMGPRSAEHGWATWEVSPAIQYGSAEFSVRYVGFARGSYLPWNTVAFGAGYKF